MKRRIICAIAAGILSLSLASCNSIMLSDEESESMESARSLPSRSDFENLDKDSSVEEIIEQFGNCSYEGSGIVYHVWLLDDGSKAKLVFNSKGKIEFIYIVTDDSGERIYDRDYSDMDI